MATERCGPHHAADRNTGFDHVRSVESSRRKPINKNKTTYQELNVASDRVVLLTNSRLCDYKSSKPYKYQTVQYIRFLRVSKSAHSKVR